MQNLLSISKLRIVVQRARSNRKRYKGPVTYSLGVIGESYAILRREPCSASAYYSITFAHSNPGAAGDIIVSNNSQQLKRISD